MAFKYPNSHLIMDTLTESLDAPVDVGDMVQLDDGRAGIVIRQLPGQRAMITPDPPCLTCGTSPMFPIMGEEWVCRDVCCGAAHSAEEIKRHYQS